MRVVCTMKPQFRESSVQHTLGDWSAENGIHEIHPPKLLCDSGHQLYDILVRGQNQQKVHVPATLLQLCFRDIVHQHSLMAPTSEHTFSSWNERSNLYIGKRIRVCPFWKCLAHLVHETSKAEGWVSANHRFMYLAPVYRTSREKNFGRWQTMVQEREGKEVGPTCGPTFFVIFLLDQAHLKHWRKNNCMNVHATDVSLLSAPWFGGWNSLRTKWKSDQKHIKRGWKISLARWLLVYLSIENILYTGSQSFKTD